MSLRSYLRESYGPLTQSLVGRFEKDLHKRARYSNHHIFAMRCRDEGIIPPSLRIEPPIRTRNAFRIAEKASCAFVAERVCQTFWKRCELENKITRTKSKLENTLSSEDFQKVDRLCRGAADKTFAKTKQIHLQKLEKLSRKKPTSLRPEGASKWVFNRTERVLTSAQEEVLALGLNFTPAPSKVPLRDFASAIESGARKLDEASADDLRGRVCGILRNAKLPKSNLAIEHRTALKELKAMEGIVILPADKGNATVVMERDEYDSKMSELLNSTTYKKLKKDPTSAKENKLSRLLKSLEKSKELPSKLYNKLRPSGTQPPRIYGLPKIHKPLVPLRPIVSCINSPSYALSQYVSSIISPLAGQTDSLVRNSQHFMEEMSQVTH